MAKLKNIEALAWSLYCNPPEVGLKRPTAYGHSMSRAGTCRPLPQLSGPDFTAHYEIGNFHQRISKAYALVLQSLIVRLWISQSAEEESV